MTNDNKAIELNDAEVALLALHMASGYLNAYVEEGLMWEDIPEVNEATATRIAQAIELIAAELSWRSGERGETLFKKCAP